MSDALLTGVEDMTECPVPPGTFGWAVYGWWPGDGEPVANWLNLSARGALDAADRLAGHGVACAVMALTHEGDIHVDIDDLAAYVRGQTPEGVDHAGV